MATKKTSSKPTAKKSTTAANAETKTTKAVEKTTATKSTATKTAATKPAAVKAVEKPAAKTVKETGNGKAVETVTSVTTIACQEITCQDIAERAYLLWKERGCTHGHDVEDWLAAEAELQKIS